MEHSAKERFSLNHVKIIHDHLIITAVFFAWHKEKFISLTAEINSSQRFIQFFKFTLGLLHILLKLGKELLSELHFCSLTGRLHLLLIIQKL